MHDFIARYNHQHRHSRIRFVTPAQRHRGEDQAILTKRHAVYAAAKTKRPEGKPGKTRENPGKTRVREDFPLIFPLTRSPAVHTEVNDAPKPRFTLPGIPQHVIQRGNNREPCFLAEADYRRYLDDLQASAEKSACRIHAYVLMTNHVHLLVTPMQEPGIAEMMQALGRRYVHYVNKTYRRTGTLWEGRYKASLVDSDAHLLACMH